MLGLVSEKNWEVVAPMGLVILTGFVAVKYLLRLASVAILVAVKFDLPLVNFLPAVVDAAPVAVAAASLELRFDSARPVAFVVSAAVSAVAVVH
mmetsp:Transcript_216/g.450  ORF Transcript_216/g.450 Transcript_216/m.450 type:complete len:94 (-) Transcript_216:269-550(-)